MSIRNVSVISARLTRMMLHTCRPTSTAQNAIVVIADLRHFCKLVQLLHPPCPFSTRHSSQNVNAFVVSGIVWTLCWRDVVV